MAGRPTCAVASLRLIAPLLVLATVPVLAGEFAPPIPGGDQLRGVPAATDQRGAVTAPSRLEEALSPGAGFAIGAALHPDPQTEQGPVSLVTFGALSPEGGPHAAWDELGRVLLLEFTDAPESPGAVDAAAGLRVTAARARLQTDAGTAHTLGLIIRRPPTQPSSGFVAAGGPWVFIPVLHYESLAIQTGIAPELLGLLGAPHEALCALAAPCLARPEFDPCTDPVVMHAKDTLDACLARAGQNFRAALEAIETFNDEGLTLCLELESDWVRARCIDGVMLWSRTSLLLATRAFVHAIHDCREAYDAVLNDVVAQACD